MLNVAPGAVELKRDTFDRWGCSDDRRRVEECRADTGDQDRREKWQFGEQGKHQNAPALKHQSLQPADRRESADLDYYCTGTGVISVCGVDTFHGTIGMSGCGFASGDASSTAIAPRSAPVNEWVTRG